MVGDEKTPERLLGQARSGDKAARGRLLELYRNDLRLQARSLPGGGFACDPVHPDPSNPLDTEIHR